MGDGNAGGSVTSLNMVAILNFIKNYKSRKNSEN